MLLILDKTHAIQESWFLMKINELHKPSKNLRQFVMEPFFNSISIFDTNKRPNEHVTFLLRAFRLNYLHRSELNKHDKSC